MPDYIADPRAYWKRRRQFKPSLLAKAPSGKAEGIRTAVLSCLCVLQILAAVPAHAAPADFNTGFDRTVFSPGTSFNFLDGSCNFGESCGSGYVANGDPTPFAQQVVNINGLDYFHVIVGDPATGFAVESYTPYGAGHSGSELQGAYNPYGAGMEMSVINPGWTTSAGHPVPSKDYQAFFVGIANTGDPLDSVHVAGNGGADPSHVVFRMVMTSAAGDMSLDVNKPFLDKKPVITQTVQSNAMTSRFVADMHKLSYSDDKTPVSITNDLIIQDGSIPGIGAGDFTMANTQLSDVTAGRFTYTPGSGWNSSVGWDTSGSTFDLGVYDYAGGPGFDPFTADWTAFFNYDQNALACQRIAPGGGADFTRIDGGGAGVGSCPGHP